MDQLTLGQNPPTVQPPGPPDEPATKSCGSCLDCGYTSHEFKGYRVSWFCACHIGRAAHAGYWFEKIYPFEGNNRAKNDHGERKLREYLQANPSERSWLPDAVEHLRRRHEALRKRKLEAASVREDA